MELDKMRITASRSTPLFSANTIDSPIEVR